MEKAGSPFDIKKMTIKNRFLRSATMENMADSDGLVTDDLLKLYYDLALGGSGLIITGACAIEQKARVWDHQAAIWSDEHIEGMSNLAEKYLSLIPQADWLHLIHLATEKDDYITSIVESDTRPRGKIKTRKAYDRFIETVVNHTEPLAKVASEHH